MAYPEDYPDDLTKAKQQGYLHKHMIVLVDPATGLPYPGGIPPGGAGAYVHPNHTGDVTSVGDGVTTIVAGAVDNAKMKTIASQTIKGRFTAGTGAVEDLTAAAARLVVHSAGSNFVNMVGNPGFDDWVTTFLGWTEIGVCSPMTDNGGVAGTQYASLDPASNLTQGSFAHVEEGQLIEAVYFHRASIAGSANNTRVTIFWYDEANGSSTNTPVFFTSTAAWQKATVLALVPAGKRKARIRVEHVAGSTVPKLYVDAASLRRVVESSLFFAGTAVPTAAHTGTTAETALVTIPVPPIMGPKGILRLSYTMSGTGTGSKTMRARFGAAALAGTILQEVAATTQLGYRIFVDIANRGVTNSQLGSGSSANGVGNLGSAPLTSAIDTTVAQNIVLSAQLATAGEAMTIEAWNVELIRPN